MTWTYRVVRHNAIDAIVSTYYAIEEVFYDEAERPYGSCSVDLDGFDSVDALRAEMTHILTALDHPVLDESEIINVDVTGKDRS